MAKSKSDIPLGGAEQNMSREELAAVAKPLPPSPRRTGTFWLLCRSPRSG